MYCAIWAKRRKPPDTIYLQSSVLPGHGSPLGAGRFRLRGGTLKMIAVRRERLTLRGGHESEVAGGRHPRRPRPGRATDLSRLSRPRLSVYAAALVLAIGTIQLVASLLFYQAIDRQTLRQDHARRVAELLVVSLRVYELDAAMTATVTTSRHLEVAVSAVPVVPRPPASEELRQIGRQIVGWEPSLATRSLHLEIKPNRARRDLVGSMRLADGRWLNFRSRDISSMWPIALRAGWMTAVTTLACLILGLLALRLMLRPLRTLSQAAEVIGHGGRVAIRETGPADLSNLARAMNEMQERIARLLEDQARSFEAISHDLRTPLSRQKLAAELISDPEIGGIVKDSTDEMEAMLGSLQQFLRAQHLVAEPERFDLIALLRSAADSCDGEVRMEERRPVLVRSYREPLLLALQALFDNACRYGQTAEVQVEAERRDWFVTIRDRGPGIPTEHYGDVLSPFFRMDEARGRTTSGFGLGIPTAHRLLRRFGGDLSFANAHDGGLVVRVKIPDVPAGSVDG